MQDIEHILFDLDGTLISSYMDSAARDFHSWHVLPGRIEKIVQLRSRGVGISIVTNQAAVAFGYNTVGDVTTKLILVAQTLGFAEMDIYDGADAPRHHGATRNNGGLLSAHVAYEHPKARIERCREDPDALETNRRKPSPAMLREALAVHGVNSIRALFVGDRPEDEQAARNAGVRFAWADAFFGA